MNEGAAAQPFTLSRDGWLADHLGYHAWRINRDGKGTPLAALHEQRRQFAYAKIPAHDIGTSSRLLDFGFRTVDTALNFTGLPPGETTLGVRPAAAADREAVTSIAGRTFRYSRFHLDPAVPQATADTIKRAWAGNFFDGRRGDGMLVAEHGGRVAGFLQLLWIDDGCLVIDLIGVDTPFQGRGIGRGMIMHAARHGIGTGPGPRNMQVGTQAANIPSVRLYESLGFRLAFAQHVLHYHGGGSR